MFDLFICGNFGFVLVCLSNMHSDIVQLILRLIYAGIVRVPQKDMDQFMKAANFLKLKGFDEVGLNDTKNVSVSDDKPPTFSIKLKRIDEVSNEPTSTNDHSDRKARETNPLLSLLDRRVIANTNFAQLNLGADKFFPSDDSDGCSSDEMNQPAALLSESENGNPNIAQIPMIPTNNQCIFFQFNLQILSLTERDQNNQI